MPLRKSIGLFDGAAAIWGCSYNVSWLLFYFDGDTYAAYAAIAAFYFYSS